MRGAGAQVLGVTAGQGCTYIRVLLVLACVTTAPPLAAVLSDNVTITCFKGTHPCWPPSGFDIIVTATFSTNRDYGCSEQVLAQTKAALSGSCDLGMLGAGGGKLESGAGQWGGGDKWGTVQARLLCKQRLSDELKFIGNGVHIYI